MKRRVVCVLLGLAFCSANADDGSWNDKELGLYIHYGLTTFAGPKNGKPTDFRAKRIDATGWARTAKAFGAKYICLTVKHEQGFCLWDSTDYEQDLGSSPAKRMDIIGDAVKACKAEGIAFSIHYSIPDRFSEGSVKFKGTVSADYFETIKKHVRELLERYPDIGGCRFDGAHRLSNKQRLELYNLVKSLNPDCSVNVERVKKQGTVLLNVPGALGLPANAEHPMEGWDSVVEGWCWKPESQLNSEDRLYRSYVTARQSGANLLVNVGPDQDGKIPSDQVRVLAELKKQIEKNPVPKGKVKSTVSSAPTANGGSGSSNYEQQLKKLKALFDQGLISKEIYEQKQKELLDSLLDSEGGGAAQDETASEPVDLKLGLVLDMGFDKETELGQDRSDHGNHGRVKGASWVEDGRIGGACRFIQTKRTNRIEIEDSDSLDVEALTVCVWIKTDDVGSGWTRIIDKHWETGYCLTMGGTMSNGSKSFHGKAGIESGKGRYLGTEKIVADGNWHFLVAVLDGAGQGWFYIDGKLDNQNLRIKETGPIHRNDCDLTIGNATPGYKEKDGQPTAYDGLMDELRIYNRVLSPAEVQALYKRAE
jgi:alpha-L-fucosidase